MTISKEFVQSVRNSLEKHPEVELDRLARSLNATEADVITALPVAMRLKARNTSFEGIWSVLSQWDNLGTVLFGKNKQAVPLRDGLSLRLLKQGKLKISSQDGDYSFDILKESLGYIWFLSRTKKKGAAHSICFLDKQGQHLLSFIPDAPEQDGSGNSQPDDFESMKKSFGVVPMPKNRCKGCKVCSCHAATSNA